MIARATPEADPMQGGDEVDFVAVVDEALPSCASGAG